MNVEALREICVALPGVTEDIKWGNDLCFCVAEKMFCVTGLEGSFSASFKVPEEEFEELINSDGIIPAPYLGRYKWVLVTDSNRLKKSEWEKYLAQSYELVKAKLPKRLRDQVG